MKNQTGSWAGLVGRECLRDGLSAFLPRLVGPENAERVAKDW
jgi:hypothetical protein